MIQKFVLFVAFVFLTEYGFTQMIPEPIFKTTPPKREKITLEDQYFFTVREYEPPIKVRFIKREAASYENPEMAAISNISAMAAKDFNWFRSTWTETSQKIMDERDAVLNQTPVFWTKLWEKSYKNRRVNLTQRVETGEYVFIAYKLITETKSGIEPTEKDIELMVVLKNEKGKWLATQELVQDPVLHYWKTPDIKVKRIIRGIEIKGSHAH